MEAEGTCTLCGAGVRNVITEGGKIWELDTTPDPDGVVQMITNGRGEIRARVLGPTERPAPPGEGYRRHKCPPPPDPGPTCDACRLPMDRELALKERWIVHPSCEPDHLDQVASERAAERARTVVRRPRRSGQR